MKGLISAFKNIAIGGVLFLIPVTIAVMVIGKVLGVLDAVAAPMAGFLPTDTILGLGLAQVIAVVLLLLMCFVAGLVARSAPGRGLVTRIEAGILTKIPGYGVIKALADQVLRSHEQTERFVPVLVRTDSGLRPALEVERLPTGEVAVMLPGSPNPWSGHVVYAESDNVEPLDMKAGELIHILEELGIGSSKYRKAASD